LKYIDTIEQVNNCFGRNSFDLEIWREYAARIHPGLPEKCETDAKGYDFERQLLPLLNDSLNQPERLQNLSGLFQNISRVLQARLPLLFDKEIDLDIILYLGLGNGAGWATSLNGKPVILLGAEKILELDWDNENELKALIFHELGHIWHRTYGNMYLPVSIRHEKSLLQLYQEGIAMVCEQILCDNQNHFHQDDGEWLRWCMEQEPMLKKEFSDRMLRDESTQDFFGDWTSFRGHSDTGYFLGCRFIRFLQKDYTLTEIANLPYEILHHAFSDFAGA